MKTKKILLIVVGFLVVLAGCKQAPSQVIQPSQGSITYTKDNKTNIAHVKEVVDGKTIKLNIDIDVDVNEVNKEYAIYNAYPIAVNHNKWFKYFFGEEKQKLEHFYDNWQSKHLKMQEITDQIINSTFGYRNSNIEVQYLLTDSTFGYFNNEYQAVSLNECAVINAPQKEVIQALQLSNEFINNVAEDRLMVNNYTVYQPINQQSIMVVDYKHSNINILIDNPPLNIDEHVIKPDGGVVFIQNNKVVFSSLTVRDFKHVKTTAIISLEQVLNTLRTYVDTIEAYTENYINDISKKSEFNIKDISLKYYPFTIEDKNLANTYAGTNGAYVTYKPVWVISSGKREGNNLEFVMIINATTGEIIR